ncbi:ribonucleoside-diphosphate reductase subunit alpha [Terrabacter lapilli]|uniref:Ribonucleoside-diphosphate reductase n=1 Tax=Terrabacter lapilli TaxID=436231 RepID=A0ABN2SE26_9MICO
MNTPLHDTTDRAGSSQPAPGAHDAGTPAGTAPTSSPAPARVSVTKRDGSREPFDADRINRAVERATEGLENAVGLTVQIASELAITLFDGITTEQLDQAAIQVAVQNVKDDPAFDRVAARLLLKTLYKRVLGGYETPRELTLLHRARFPGYVRDAVEAGSLDRRLATGFDLERLADELDPEHDELLTYIGVVTMRNRYLLSGPGGTDVEVPQYFWMRVAMGLSLNEDDATASAIRFYRAMARLEYLPAGSTLVNAGTPQPQLSNCFVMQMEDDIEHIAKSVRDVMWITKGTGGIGLSVTKLRAEGSPIRSNNTTSTGPIPFMHTIDSTLRAISRGGKKFGALCFYMENWHLDFPQFLDLRQQAGDPYRRTRTANTAVWISDEFMRRVERDETWYLFDPLETPDLVELTGAAFSRRYAEYVELAEQGRLRTFRTVRAREQFTAILVALQTASHPWLTWKDTINLRALNDNTGTIHLSNLCTEITLPQDRDNTAVCNLASVNLARHLRADVLADASDGSVRPGGAPDLDAVIDWPRLEATVRTAVRQLDNLIDITLSSVAESEQSNEVNRAIGLGMMGFTDVVERLGITYGGEASLELVDRLSEFISHTAIDESAELARSRGSYPNFAGSGWSRGRVPLDTIDDLEADRGVGVEVDRTSRLDWDRLREKVAGGMRNATLMAVAPTASIGLVAGTTPGLDPQFSQLFSRTTSSGKFLEVNRNLVATLKQLGLWEHVREELLRSQGDVQSIEAIPAPVREAYRTSFQLSPYAFLHVAARAQKWVDQAISRNMYLETRDVAEMAQIYAAAWRMGVKTTYYLHVKPRHTAEQSTVRVNKATATGRSGGGFGFARPAPAVGSPPPPAPAAPAVTMTPTVTKALAESLELAPVESELVCPTDPQERLNCEACQ